MFSFLVFTNNENALFIEGDDRRFTCHKANNRYANNIKYFKPIWNEVRDKQFCRNAFEFFATRKYDLKNAFVCFNNDFKNEQKQLNLPNGLKFIKEFAENDFQNDFDDIVMDGDKIKTKALGNAYRQWCVESGIKFHLGSFKTQLKKMDIVDKICRHLGVKVKCYIFNKDILRLKFRKHLKDNTFDFDMIAENEGERQDIAADKKKSKRNDMCMFS